MSKLANSLLLSALFTLLSHGAVLGAEPAAGRHSDGHGKALTERGRPHHRRSWRKRLPPPAGYNGFMTFLENGEFNPQMPHPVVPGCFSFFCSGDYFHVTVRERTLDQVLAIELEAKLFFATRFGVDVDDPANQGRLFLRRYYRDPRSNLVAYPVSKRRVPRQGWQVHDGGWSLIFLEDFTLGGAFAGVTVPPGSTLNWGEFVIVPHGSRAKRPLVISYRSAMPPLVRLSDDALLNAFQYELYRGALDDPANDWGNASFAHQGLDQGVEFNRNGGGGEIRANARHVLTFSDDGGL